MPACEQTSESVWTHPRRWDQLPLQH